MNIVKEPDKGLLQLVNGIFLDVTVKYSSTLEIFASPATRSFIFKKGDKYVEVNRIKIALEDIFDKPTERLGYNFRIPEKGSLTRYWKVYRKVLFDLGKCVEVINKR